MRFVPNPACASFGINFDDEIKLVMLRGPITKLQHLGKLVGRVDVQNGKWDLSKKRFASEPDENVGIFPHRPRHRDVLEGVIRLPKNENALVLELVEMSAVDLRHSSFCLSGSGRFTEPPAAGIKIITDQAI